ncbi:phosphatidylglycerol lysyltransferase domain-containing protein [Neobacillus niacini]|uniref:phosphatidylglycerol lysyltransferase domain-containing protein n=1 Tax=Neobacillus niacini TaxID=86668 RepID=UPI0007AB299E|nr:phosphatidylglycerol lysyltransferase domain-containing protein [Neobacillus niacini]MEC1521892.1 phosphatidylglycerol lysyltransferase domain-containing protein [Neobacillus niacini]
MKQPNKNSKHRSIGKWLFNEIELNDKLLFDKFMKESECPATVWSSNFAYLWASSQSRNRKTVWKIIDGMLVPFFYNVKHQYLSLVCLPFGKGNAEHVVTVLYKCMVYCYELNKLTGNQIYSRVRTINEAQMQFLQSSKKFNQYFDPKKLMGIERHYSIQKLINLAGKEFAYVRRKINKFHRKYPQAIIRKYAADTDYQKLVKFNRNWTNNHDKSLFDGTYFKEILKYPDELDHTVIVVEIDNQIVGMTSGGCLPTGQSWSCLRKGDQKVEGLSELLLCELVKECYKVNSSIEYMNDGSDLGEKGLRFFKERFRPELNLNRYRVYLKNFNYR